MLAHSLSGMSMPGCGTGSGCYSVLNGRWAYIAGIIPVSALSVGTYLALILCLSVYTHNPQNETASTAAFLMRLLSGAILTIALWFIGLQVFVLHTFCKYCIAVHALGITISFLTLSLTGNTRLLSACAGVCIAIVTAAVQVITLPEAVYEEGSSYDPLPAFSPSEVPSIGPGDAPIHIELLFDYRCSHCRKLHALLPELAGMFQGKVVFLTLPTPLSNACNYYLPSGPDAFDGSCELTKLALALWQADTAAYRNFDKWLFETEGSNGWYPRSITEATAKAKELNAKYIEFYNNDWTNQYLTKVFELFGRTASSKGGGIPRFVYGQHWLVPDADTPETLYGLLSNLIKMGQTLAF